jgi:nucleoside-diphosphate-sugar epimerase
MRVVIIGGSGHIGTYLTPRLVEAGHAVLNVSRGQRSPYQPHNAWKRVEQVVLDRATAEAAGTFGSAILDLKPDAVIDLTCFAIESARHLVESLRGRIQHLLHCGTIWVHGPSVEAPFTEEQPRRPIDDYGRRKAEIENYLLSEARLHRFPATILHPGHIVGPGWIPLNPAGNFNQQIYADLARGNEVCLPNQGHETVHHVHADDVAQSFMKSLANWSGSVGESFHVVSPAALSLRGFAEQVADWFGVPARLQYLPWEDWRKSVTEQESNTTWGHIARSSICSIQKARRLLDYEPRYRSIEAIYESLTWLIQNGQLKVR